MLQIVLRDEAAWNTLPKETREELYRYLPKLPGGYNIDVHPLSTSLQPYIEGEIRLYQTDLNDGKETKKWREEAMKAGMERSSGSWDALKEQQLEEDWGKIEDASTKVGSLAEHLSEEEEVRVTEQEARAEANKAINGAQS